MRLPKFLQFWKRKKAEPLELPKPLERIMPHRDYHDACLKCGVSFGPEFVVPGVRYVELERTIGIGIDPMTPVTFVVGEAMKRTCPHCGYAWYEPVIGKEEKSNDE